MGNEVNQDLQSGSENVNEMVMRTLTLTKEVKGETHEAAFLCTRCLPVAVFGVGLTTTEAIGKRLELLGVSRLFFLSNMMYVFCLHCHFQFVNVFPCAAHSTICH